MRRMGVIDLPHPWVCKKEKVGTAATTSNVALDTFPATARYDPASSCDGKMRLVHFPTPHG